MKVHSDIASTVFKFCLQKDKLWPLSYSEQDPEQLKLINELKDNEALNTTLENIYSRVEETDVSMRIKLMDHGYGRK